MSKYSVYGKKIWLIGASQGIGAALARELALEGATILASSRTPEALDALTASLPGLNHEVWPLDVSDRAGFAQAAQALMQQHPDLDIAIYNAGTYKPQLVSELTLQEGLQTLEVNLAGVLTMLDAVLPRFRARQQGALLLMGSVGGYFGLPRALAYSASKAGVICMAETLKVELAPSNIRVQVVCPGFVRTRLTQNNPFPMPLVISAEKAAIAIVKGIGRGTFEIHFPKAFSLLMKFLALLPRPLRLTLLAQLMKGPLKQEAVVP